MSLTDLILAEMKFVYGDIIRRKSVLLMFIAFPYVLTLFIVLIGYSVGNRQVFVEKIGVDPEIFFLTSGFLLMSILGVSDDLLWRPNFDRWMGTLPYLILSPVPRLYRYIAIPIPRLILVVITGLTSVIPVYIYFYGLEGLWSGLAVILLAAIAAILFTTPIMIIMGLVYGSGGEHWRIINIIRPLLLILLGAYYPRYMMPLAGLIFSYMIPSSHIVEIVQRMLTHTLELSYALTLIGIGTALFILYAPLGVRSINYWETKKLKEGVR
ncbi:hypothetical protein [Staphylothermus hellenicus]|uniref:ABC-2 type transporter n=1 Tax=Staphylothermus hellenicus (strain DSM 12710 / JCM 10830 / BK20S6-10-b1 / P8) TaxID=591019 RepID=D7DCG9_STAHD|nr:hypothetical protein [Staphylothermus hellenicus]ADI31866.1 hypothetical protein Shell_0750 [Staphylothermus hellenicus DSM 12710]